VYTVATTLVARSLVVFIATNAVLSPPLACCARLCPRCGTACCSVYSETLAGYVASVCTGVPRVFAVRLCFGLFLCYVFCEFSVEMVAY